MPTTIKFKIIGAHEGKTVALGNYAFVDGVFEFTGPDLEASLLSRVLREQYQAYPAHEFDEAKKAFEETQAAIALDEPEPTLASDELTLKQRLMARRFIVENLDPAEVLGHGQAAAELTAVMNILRAEDGEEVVAKEPEGPTAEELAAIEAKRIAEQGNGGGAPAPTDAKIETVADAIQALDPANDEHWTSRGIPSIEAMTKLLGRQVARADVEKIAPDYTRSVAKAAKAQ